MTSVSVYFFVTVYNCYTVSQIREEWGMNRRTFKTLIIKWTTQNKSGRPSRMTAAHKTQIKSRPGPLSSFTVVAPPFILPELLRGTRDRWVAQVSFIFINSHGSRPLVTTTHLKKNLTFIHKTICSRGSSWTKTMIMIDLITNETYWQIKFTK